MTDFSDLRRSASQHSKSGNYWAGKCLMLLDLLEAKNRQPQSIERKETQVSYRNLTEAILTLNGAVEGDDFTADDAEELARCLVGADVVLHRASFVATSAVAGHRRWSAGFTLSAPEADARG